MYATLAQYFCVALKETICKFFLETRGVLLPLYWKIFLQSKGLHSKDEGKLLTRLVIDIDGLVSSSLLKYAFHIQTSKSAFLVLAHMENYSRPAQPHI